MNKNLLDRLVKKESLNLLVKPIFNNESDKLTLQKFLHNQKFLNYNDVLKILKINFNLEQPIGYTLIDDKKEIVGFLGTIFSSIPVKEKFVEHCYLHSWIVLKKYRIEAFKLIIPLIKKNIFLSTYSPISSLEGLYKKLSFEEHHFFSKFVFFLPLSKFNNSHIKYSEDAAFFRKYLKEKDKIFLKDHAHTSTKKFFVYFNENLHDNIFIILKKKTKKIIFSILDIIYISDFEKFSLHEKNICVEFLKKFKTIIFKFNDIHVDKICVNNSIFSKIVKKNIYYLNKPKNFKFNILYSELLI